MRGSILRVTVFLAAVYALACLTLFAFQRALIYFPVLESHAGDANVISLMVGETKLLVTTQAKESEGAVLYFGGNAEDVAYSLPTLRLAFPEKAIYLMHYRGYGGSAGSASEQALFTDALALYDYAQKRHQKISVIGRSLGSGVAAYLASRRRIERLILVTPYDSLAEIAASQYPFFPVRWLLRDKFESTNYVPRISAPTLIIAAENDTVIPAANTKTLFQQFPVAQAQMVTLRACGHNSLSVHPDYVATLAADRAR